jgi:hypothetical protein
MIEMRLAEARKLSDLPGGQTLAGQVVTDPPAQHGLLGRQLV